MKSAIALMLVPTLLAVGCKNKQPSPKQRGPVAAPQTRKSKGLPAAPRAQGRSTFLEDFGVGLDRAERQLLRLARAIPQGKYTWRAHPDTMSLAELFLHIAGAHFGIARAAGHPPPADVKGKGLRKSTTDKKKIIKLLKRAFAHAREAATKAKGADLSVTRKLWGKQRSKRVPYLVMLVHQNQHLGQLQAWTRSAGVAKPWVKKRKARGKKGAKAKQ